ncbi:MAG: VPLPA-CTERM sorting domain-containing protein [Paracoccus sp.]|nr:VPLPA-CTERM sorting domain-containing protein [Paracoccus sp. (in: a-proteobacteria)]
MIKSAVLAAVAVVGIGAAAEAATFEQINLKMRYEGTTFQDVIYADLEDDEDTGSYLGDVSSIDAPYWLKHQLFGNLKIGDVVDFVAEVFYGSSDAPDGNYDNGGSAPVCNFAGKDCTGTGFAWRYPDGRLTLGNDFYEDISGYTTVGGSLSYFLFSLEETYFSDDGKYIYFVRGEDAKFTIVQPAPVPLPASAALLPLGFGALAMMRKRRKRVS